MQHRMFGLDALRAAAVLAVMAGHSDFILPSLVVPPTLGVTAVGAFFALSGFLVGGIALREVRASGDVWRFWCRRWLRTLPAALVVASVVAAIAHPPLPDMLGALTFSGFVLSGTGGKFMPHYWSLAVEEWAYLLLPSVLLAIGRRNPLLWLMGLLALLVVWRETAVRVLEMPNDAWIYATSLRLDAILVGVAAAAAATRLTDDARKGLAVAAGLALAALPLLPSVSALQPTVIPALFALTLPALAAWQPSLPRFARAAVWHVAAISYGLYLVHFPVYLGARTLLAGQDPVAVLAAAVAASWLAALALRRYVELPFLALRDRLPARSRAVLAAD